MAVFFIDTSSGRIATQRQLIEAGIASDMAPPPRPWHKIQGTNDATTMWYALLRRQEKGVFIGSLVLRHSDHYASLLERGWEEVEVPDIHVGDASPGAESVGPATDD
jgi:hypothetical protein